MYKAILIAFMMMIMTTFGHPEMRKLLSSAMKKGKTDKTDSTKNKQVRFPEDDLELIKGDIVVYDNSVQHANPDGTWGSNVKRSKRRKRPEKEDPNQPTIDIDEEDADSDSDSNSDAGSEEEMTI